MNIIIKTQFVGLHQWSSAPDEVAFLRNLHRHQFRVRTIIGVTYSRQLEFFMVKKKLDDYIQCSLLNELHNNSEMSCEDLALKIQGFLQSCYGSDVKVLVSEDGEVGAEV